MAAGPQAMTAEVWAAPLDLVRPHWLAYLDPAERERYDRYRQPDDRSRFLLGACLVRVVAGLRLGTAATDIGLDRTCPRCDEPHGRVRVVGARLSVSVSHAGDWVLVAESGEGTVGVDVERVDRGVDPLELAPVALTDEERLVLLRVDPSRRAEAFARYWTRKEAVLKATGDGLGSPPSRLHVSDPDDPPAVLDWSERPDLAGRVGLSDLDVAPGYAGCLAVVGAEPPAGPARPRLAAEALSTLDR
jgi:4'-phosphopantetheinyl transferase